MSGDLDHVSNCLNLTHEQRLTLVAARSSTAFVSAVSCAIALVLFCHFKLHRKFSYRLILYLLVCILVESTFNVLQLPVAWYDPDNAILTVFCKILAFAIQYIIWPLLLLMLLIVIQFFSLIVWFKKLEVIELPYVVFSFLFPLLFAWVPFVTDTFGPSGAWCWIAPPENDCKSRVGVIEQFALWYGPLSLVICLSLLMTVSSCCFLVVRSCKCSRRSTSRTQATVSSHDYSQCKDVSEADSNQIRYRRAVRETLPLLAYPVIFFFISLFSLADRTVRAVTGSAPYWVMVVHAFVNTLWGLFAMLTFTVHIASLGREKRAALRRSRSVLPGRRQLLVHETTAYEIEGSITATNVTDYSPSEEDEEES